MLSNSCIIDCIDFSMLSAMLKSSLINYFGYNLCFKKNIIFACSCHIAMESHKSMTGISRNWTHNVESSGHVQKQCCYWCTCCNIWFMLHSNCIFCLFNSGNIEIRSHNQCMLARQEMSWLVTLALQEAHLWQLWLCTYPEHSAS